MAREYALLFVALTFFALTADAGSRPPLVNGSVPQDDPVSRGGRLYDKWWVELGLPEPTTTHPAYPEQAARRGSDSWRCKECHGWDYRGRDGAYRKGSHFTGIKGIRDYDGSDPKAVLRILTDNNHHYQSAMGPLALELLAGFVARGQVDMSRYIATDGSEMTGGEMRRGGKLFKRYCSRCHGEDGRYLNFSGDATEPEYVGTIAVNNPWEAWHKIRNGHPGAVMPMGPMMMGRWRHNEIMPPFRTLSVSEQLAILRYARSLPVE